MNETSSPTANPLSLSEPSRPVAPEPGRPTSSGMPAFGTPPSAHQVPRPSVPWNHTPGAPTQTERSWAIGAHLSGFVAAWFALGFIGPLVVMLTGGTTSPYVRRHAVEALNFNLSVLIYAAVSGLLMLLLVGFLLLPLVGLLYLVATILGALAASRGEEYRYPASIRFVR